MSDNICYRLDGKSLEAARTLDLLVRDALDKNPIPWQNAMTDAFFDRLIKTLMTDHPEAMKTLGQDIPGTVIWEGRDIWPRAYRQYPQFFASPEQPPQYFMYSPVDYKNEHFVPEDAARLDDHETQIAGNLLFAGGWADNAPILVRRREGVPIPAEIVQTGTALARMFNGQDTNRFCFLARGRSFEMVEAYRQRGQDYRDYMDHLVDGLRDIALAQAGPGHYVNSSYNHSALGGRDVKVTLSVRQDGVGTPVKMADNVFYKVLARAYGDYTLEPNIDTPEGQKLLKAIDAIPPTPSLGDDPEMMGHFGLADGTTADISPRLCDFGGLTALVYYTGEPAVNTGFCPPDAFSLSHAEFQWLEKDSEDVRAGITPPPPPPEMKALMEQLKQNRLLSAPTPSLPAPAPP